MSPFGRSETLLIAGLGFGVLVVVGLGVYRAPADLTALGGALAGGLGPVVTALAILKRGEWKARAADPGSSILQQEQAARGQTVAAQTVPAP